MSQSLEEILERKQTRTHDSSSRTMLLLDDDGNDIARNAAVRSLGSSLTLEYVTGTANRECRKRLVDCL